METLVIVRHGDYDRFSLNRRGRNQIKALGEKLMTLVKENSVLLLTSIAPRAKESAEILRDILKVGVEEHEILWSEKTHKENLPGALELVRSRMDGVDTLILITHYEYVAMFPAYFAEKELGVQVCSSEIGNGEAWVLDCQNKTLTRIRCGL